MKTLAWMLVVLLCAAAAGAAEIDALIDAARAAPPEFAADALIRMAGTDKLDKARRVELLEQAFQKAADAQLAFPSHAAALRLDGSATYWNRLYRQGLDTLSLRLRAVEAMLLLDREKGRDWFARIPSPQVPRLTCADFLVYDVARFYDVLTRVVSQDSKPDELLRPYAGAVTSPVQLAPMAHVLATAASVKDTDFQTLVVAFATAMGKVSGDDRSFTFSTSLGKEIEALIAECKKRQVTPLPLIEGYRLYLVANFSGVRCADNDQIRAGQQSFGIFTAQPSEQAAADYVSFFNDKLRMAPLAPIQELEATPSRLEGVVAAQHYCEDAECKAFVKQFRGLVFGENGIPIPPAQRSTPEWQGRLKQRLAALADWKMAPGADTAIFFREKSGAYVELLNLAQNGPNRELVLAGLLNFVRKNPFQNVSRAEWFLPVNSLIGRVSLDPAGLSRFVEELRKVDDPLILLYANLESMAPRSPDLILPLL